MTTRTLSSRAQGEVENAIAAYLGAQRQVTFFTDSVKAAARAVELAEFQYREGAIDYTGVLITQQFLVTEQDRLVATKGSVVLNLVAMYKALGGGWELRVGKDLVLARKQAANERADLMGRNAHDRRANAGPRCCGVGYRSRARLVALALVVAEMVAAALPEWQGRKLNLSAPQLETDGKVDLNQSFLL